MGRNIPPGVKAAAWPTSSRVGGRSRRPAAASGSTRRLADTVAGIDPEDVKRIERGLPRLFNTETGVPVAVLIRKGVDLILAQHGKAPPTTARCTVSRGLTSRSRTAWSASTRAWRRTTSPGSSPDGRAPDFARGPAHGDGGPPAADGADYPMGIPSQRATREGHAAGMEGRVRGGRAAEALSARLSPDRRAESGPGGGSRSAWRCS